MGGAARGRAAVLDEILALPARRRRSRHRRRDHAQLLRPDPDDHPAGDEPLHRDAHRRRSRRSSATTFWGFWMLGGTSGGGMGFIFDPSRRDEAKDRVQDDHAPRRSASWSTRCRSRWSRWSTTSRSTRAARSAELLTGRRGADAARLLPADAARRCCAATRSACRRRAGPSSPASAPPAARSPSSPGWSRRSSTGSCPRAGSDEGERQSLDEPARRSWASTASSTSRSGPTCGAGGSAWRRTGCRRAPTSGTPRRTTSPTSRALPSVERLRERGRGLLREGAVAVVTLAAGVGSRWTEGAGVVKAINPFCKLAGEHRTFLEIHLAKSRRVGAGVRAAPIPHVITTSYLTHEPIRQFLDRAATTTATPARCSCRPGGRSGCAWCRWRATCASPGRRCRSRCSTSRRRRSARACARALIGWAAAAGRGQRLHRQPAAPVPAPGRPLVRGPEHAQERRAGRAARGAARPPGADAAQHRHGRDGRRSGAAGLAPRIGRGDDASR